MKTRTITYRVVVPKNVVDIVTYALAETIFNTAGNVAILEPEIRKSTTKEKKKSKKWMKELKKPLSI